MRTTLPQAFFVSVAIAAASGAVMAADPPTTSAPDRASGTTAQRPTPDTAIPDNEHLRVPPARQTLPEHRSGTLSEGDGHSDQGADGNEPATNGSDADVESNDGTLQHADPEREPALPTPPAMPRTPADVLHPVTPT